MSETRSEFVRVVDIVRDYRHRARARFLRHVDIPLVDDACWTWTASRGAKGYGQFVYAGSPRPAQRVSAALFLGFDIDSPLHVLHRCDNPPCVNPDHLFFGTNYDNMRDKEAKGRLPYGSQLHNAKLSESEIREIRALLAGGASPRTLGLRWGVHPRTIRDAGNGVTWRHVA